MSKVNAKKLLALLLPVMLLALPVMASEQQDLIDIQQLTQQQISYKTSQVYTGSFIKETSTVGTAYFPLTYKVAFDGSDAKFVEYTVAEGDTVKAGDVLARFSIEVSNVAKTRLERQLARAKEELKAGILQRQEAVAALKKEITGETDSYEKEKKEITLQKLEIELEQYRYTQQRSIDTLQQELDELYRAQENNVLISPADGVVTELTTKKVDEKVSSRETLAVIVSEDITLLRASNTFGDLRYNMPVQVTVGRGNQQTTLTGRVVSADNAIAESGKTGYAYILLNILDGRKINVTDPKVTAEIVRLDNVPVVNWSAVTQENGKYYVNKLNHGVVQKRYILIGMQNGQLAWVLDGVTEGETLIVD